MAKVILFLIIILGAAIRLYLFNTVPAALNIDEAAIGYNAFALSLTGADEHGRAFPILFESFGDWKMPLYIYLTTIPVALFGLTEFASRFISLLSGVGSVILIYFIGKKLFNSTKVGLVASLFLTLSPWSIFFSRMAIEANLAMFLFLGGFLLFLNKKYLLSIFLFSLTLFTYHSYLIFTPLFLIGFYILNFKEIKFPKTLLVGIVIFFVVAAFAWLNIQSLASSKTNDIGFWSNQNVLYNRIDQFRVGERDLINKALHNKYSGIAYHFTQNYFSSFNPSFLFDKGGEKTLHNSGFTGVLLISDAILLLAGLFFLIKAKSIAVKTILLWIILGPISSSITLDHPSATRLYVTLPGLILLAAYGAKSLARYWLIAILISAIVAASSLYFLDGYFRFLNLKRAQFMGAGFKEVVLEVKKHPDLKVVWARSEEFPYIYILFYNQTNPDDFQKTVEYFDTSPEGFRLVKSFGRYSFPPSLNSTPLDPPDFKKDTIYVEKFGVHEKTYSVNLPSGEPRFWIYVSDHDGY